MVGNRQKSQETRHRSVIRRRRFYCFGLLGVLVLALFLPVQIRMWSLQGEFKQLQTQEKMLRQDQSQIKDKVRYYASDAYVEEAARQNFGLVKPGEAPILPAAPGQAQTLPKSSQAVVYKD